MQTYTSASRAIQLALQPEREWRSGRSRFFLYCLISFLVGQILWDVSPDNKIELSNFSAVLVDII